MDRRSQHQDRALSVTLYDCPIGTLTRDATDTLSFQYDKAYARDETNPPLSTRMPLRAAPYGHEDAHTWFDALLPEGLRREHLARIVNAASTQTWELLYTAGGECAGAVRAIATVHRSEEPRCIALSVQDLHDMLSEIPVEPLGTFSAAARISLAGAQDKVALYRDPHSRWTLPTGGHPSSHILKPQSRRFEQIVQNEHYCMTLARYAGIDTARTHVERVDGLEVLVVERYDRATDAKGTLRRVHQEDFAQALGARKKYEAQGGPTSAQLFSVPGVAREMLFDRILFNWMVGNCDAHAKNHSILEPGTPRARLAPAYDIVSSECYEGLDRTLAMAIGDAANLNEVDATQVECLGDRIGFPPGEATRRTRTLAQRVREAMRTLAKLAVEPGPVRTDIVEMRTDEARDWDERTPRTVTRKWRRNEKSHDAS